VKRYLLPLVVDLRGALVTFIVERWIIPTIFTVGSAFFLPLQNALVLSLLFTVAFLGWKYRNLEKQVHVLATRTQRTRFRLIGGTHVQDGITYNKGDIVETDLDLMRMFVNKFEKT
jgi:hypothetical protein